MVSHVLNANQIFLLSYAAEKIKIANPTLEKCFIGKNSTVEKVEIFLESMDDGCLVVAHLEIPIGERTTFNTIFYDVNLELSKLNYNEFIYMGAEFQLYSEKIMVTNDLMEINY